MMKVRMGKTIRKKARIKHEKEPHTKDPALASGMLTAKLQSDF